MKDVMAIGGLTVLEFGNKITTPHDSKCIAHCRDSKGSHYILNCEISGNGIGFFVSEYDIDKLGRPNVKSSEWKRSFYKTISRDNFKEIILDKKDYNYISDYLTCGKRENITCICCGRPAKNNWFYYNGFRCEKCIETIKNGDNWKYKNPKADISV